MTGIFQRIFSRQKSEADESRSTDSSSEKTIPLRAVEAGGIGPLQLTVGCAQSIGRQRDHNEDALFTLTVNLSNEKARYPFGIYIVADGMGGHLYGEVASDVAVRAMGSYLVNRLYPTLVSAAGELPADTILSVMETGIQETQRVVLEEAPGGGTTLTALVLHDRLISIGHIGDSRAYTISPDGEIQALTRDHSLVNRLVELGQLSAEEASTHPQRNVLYRALGQAEPVEADIVSVPMPTVGHLLICSDGLWGVISEDKISELVRAHPLPQQACQAMVEAANANGGPDNITAILIHLPG